MAGPNARLKLIRSSRLHLVTDRRLCQHGLQAAVKAAVRGGVDVVHLREHDLDARELLKLALELRAAMGDGAALAINDRIDVALAAGADAVQLGGTSLPVAAARTILGSGLTIGASVHGPEEAAQAEADGADYLVLGTIYPSRSHPGFAGCGPSLVREVSAHVKIPIFAIGGIAAENVAAVLAAGAQGAAAIGAILADRDPEGAARRLRRAIEEGGEAVITVIANGKQKELSGDMSVSRFLELGSIPAQMVVVELRGEIVHRHEYDCTIIRDGDHIEVVRMMGGG